MFFLGKKGYEGKQKSPENRTFKLYVFRIKCLRYEFVFPGERPHAHNNTQASGSHFIEPLVGHRGVPEVILGAHHEISRGQVTGIKILLYQLAASLGIRAKPSLTASLEIICLRVRTSGHTATKILFSFFSILLPFYLHISLKITNFTMI